MKSSRRKYNHRLESLTRPKESTLSSDYYAVSEEKGEDQFYQGSEVLVDELNRLNKELSDKKAELDQLCLEFKTQNEQLNFLKKQLIIEIQQKKKLECEFETLADSNYKLLEQKRALENYYSLETDKSARLKEELITETEKIRDLLEQFEFQGKELKSVRRILELEVSEKEKLKKELGSLYADIEVLSQEVTSSKRTIESKAGKIKLLGLQLIDHENKLSEVFSTQKELVESLALKDEEIQKLTQKLIGKDDEFDELAREFESQKKRLNELKKKLETEIQKNSEREGLENELKNKTEAVNELLNKFESQVEEGKKLRREFELEAQEKEKLKKELESLSIHIEALLKDIASLKKTVELKDDQIKLLTSTYSDRDDEFETLSAKFKAQNELLDIIKRQLETKDRQIKILTSDLVSLDTENSVILEENEALKINLALQISKIERLNEELSNKTYKINKLADNLEFQIEKVKSLTRALELEICKKEKLESEFKPLYDNIESLSEEIKELKIIIKSRNLEIRLLNSKLKENDSEILTSQKELLKVLEFRNEEVLKLTQKLIDRNDKFDELLHKFEAQTTELKKLKKPKKQSNSETMDKEILEESGFRGGEIAKKSENIFEPNPKKRKSIPETHLDNDNLNYSLNKKEFSSDLFKKIVESMLPQINKQTKQYIAINQINFEEINNEEHNALFPSQSGLGELTRKSSSYRSELCYKVKGFSCGSLEQKFEHLADALWHELRIKGNLQNRKTIKISNTVPSSPRIKKLCLEIFQERFIGTYIKFAVDDSALNQSKLTDLSQDRLSTNPFTVFNGNMRRSTMTEERKERQARFIY
ncbi:membrane-binding protein [Coxiella burnetii]|uniref:membrane-binding protein n=1 Tax=Coxiella burnetii TaxID=777 RepID=UPI000BFD78D5|nr:membrane-binding protein [Coxiella burnetii]PHH58085.1 membrane-binding protein [Coxiella burnetii]